MTQVNNESVLKAFANNLGIPVERTRPSAKNMANA